jgi:hypothetical protein
MTTPNIADFELATGANGEPIIRHKADHSRQFTLFGFLNQFPATDPADIHAIAVATELYSTEETEFDDNPQVSHGEDGAFVQAWVFVSNSELGITDDDDDNPFHPESPEGRAWDLGDRSSIKESEHDPKSNLC